MSKRRTESKRFNNSISDGIEPLSTNIIISNDVDKMFEYEKNQEWDKQAKKKILEAKNAYTNGVNFYQEGKYSQAVKSFKLSTRRLKAAKLNPATSNSANMNLALSYLRSNNERDKTKAIKQIESLTKEAFEERDFLYNSAIIYYDR